MSMDANEKTLTLFTTRMRQMVLQYKETKQENSSLYAMVDERDAKIKQLEAATTSSNMEVAIKLREMMFNTPS